MIVSNYFLEAFLRSKEYKAQSVRCVERTDGHEHHHQGQKSHQMAWYS